MAFMKEVTGDACHDRLNRPKRRLTVLYFFSEEMSIAMDSYRIYYASD